MAPISTSTASSSRWRYAVSLATTFGIVALLIPLSVAQAHPPTEPEGGPTGPLDRIELAQQGPETPEPTAQPGEPQGSEEGAPAAEPEGAAAPPSAAETAEGDPTDTAEARGLDATLDIDIQIDTEALDQALQRLGQAVGEIDGAMQDVGTVLESVEISLEGVDDLAGEIDRLLEENLREAEEAIRRAEEQAQVQFDEAERQIRIHLEHVNGETRVRLQSQSGDPGSAPPSAGSPDAAEPERVRQEVTIDESNGITREERRVREWRDGVIYETTTIIENGEVIEESQQIVEE